MFSSRFYSLPGALALSLAACTLLFAQTQTPPATTPPPNPAQQNATRPPGTQQQNIPPEARPVPANPTAPPGTEHPSPQAPPGTTLPAPITPVAPPANVSPGEPAPVTGPPSAPTTQTGQSGLSFDFTQPRPVPSIPSLARTGVTSDNTLSLSLNDAIRLALQNNNDIEVARDDVRFAETQLRSLQGVYDPVFTFSPQINNSVQPVSSTLSGSGSSGTVTTTDINFNTNVTRQFSTGGGNYQVFFNNTRQTSNSIFNQLNPFYASNFGVTFTQPLLRDRSIDRFRHDIRVQRKRLEQSDADFRRQTIDVISRVQRAYWDLVFALRDEQNRIANLNLARENFRRTESSVAAGASAPLQRAEVQTEFSNRESDLLLALQTVTTAENTLKQLILRDPLAKEWSASLVPTDEPTFDTTPVNLNDALQEARANRPELRRLNLQKQINDIDVKFYQNQTRPRVDIQSTLSTTGLAGTPVVPTGSLTGGIVTPGSASSGQVPLIFGNPTQDPSSFLLSQINQLRAAQGLPPATVPLITPQTEQVPGNLVGGYTQTLSNLFGFGTRNIVVGVNIQLPLHNRTAKANLAGAQIQREQLAAQMRSQELAIELDVRNAVQAVETARRRVLTAREARVSAEQQLAGEQRLYQVGRSTTFLLFQREDELATARNQEVGAETDYNKALADLQRATSTTLRANNVIVESPTAP